MTSTENQSTAALLQTNEQWEARNACLTDAIGVLLREFARPGSGRGLDIGCQNGSLTDRFALASEKEFAGIDPGLTETETSPGGATLLPGYAHQLPYEDESFACLVLANVYEHIEPSHRVSSFQEMYRVLEPGGVVVGQIPNPYFPIESHSRLPFMGWLPVRAQRKYWKLSPAPWPHDFYVVTLKHLVKDARAAGFEIEETRNFNYPLEVIPESARWAAKLALPAMDRWRFASWAWQFVLKKPQAAE